MAQRARQHGTLQSTRRALLRTAGAACLSAGLSACQRQPDLLEGEAGRISRISDGDLIALDTGLRVRLAEIEAPSSFDKAPYAEEASRLLEREALGRHAKLYYGGLSRDRYDRALAHVIAADEIGREVWLNGMMVREGAARVRTWPDNVRRVRQLYALENEAREASRGIWSLDAYRILQPEELATSSGFVITTAKLVDIIPSDQFGRLRIVRGGVSIETTTAMGDIEPGLDLTPGANIRARGRLRQNDDGETTMDLTHWAQIETTDT